MIPFDRKTHDHTKCVQTCLRATKEACAERGVKLTPLRLRVLEVLLESHRAVGAYDVLEKLQKEGFGNAPTMAYRALKFLEDNGFAHRIESKNAFIACSMPGVPHRAQFLICRGCGCIAEWVTDRVTEEISAVAEDIGFDIDRFWVEAEGCCAACKGTELL